MAVCQLIWQCPSLWETSSLMGGNGDGVGLRRETSKEWQYNVTYGKERKGKQLGLAYSRYLIRLNKWTYSEVEWAFPCFDFSSSLEHLGQEGAFSAFWGPPPRGQYIVCKHHGGFMDSCSYNSSKLTCKE